MNRFKMLLMFVLSAAILCTGISASFADTTTPATPDEVKAKTDAAAKKARADRDAAYKKRLAAKEYLKKVVEGQDAANGGAQ